MKLKGLGTYEHFLSLTHDYVITCAPIQTYARNHIITELVEPGISTNAQPQQSHDSFA